MGVRLLDAHPTRWPLVEGVRRAALGYSGGAKLVLLDLVAAHPLPWASSGLLAT